MKHCGTQKLETVRLVLRRLTMQDADAVYSNWASDPEVTRFLTWSTHTDIEVTKHVIGTWLPLYDKNDYYHWAITLKENGDKPIGTIHGLVNDDLEQVTVGYRLGQAWWHQGIMSEALQMQNAESMRQGRILEIELMKAIAIIGMVLVHVYEMGVDVDYDSSYRFAAAFLLVFWVLSPVRVYSCLPWGGAQRFQSA